MTATVPDWTRAHLHEGEEPLWWARPSLLGVVPILAGAALTAAGTVAAARYGFEPPTPFVEGSAALVLALVGLAFETARRFLRLRFTSYVVTTERIYVVTSFLETHVRAVPVARLARAALRQGPVARLFGLWTARLGTHGDERGAVEIASVRDGAALLAAVATAQRRGADASWLLRGD